MTLNNKISELINDLPPEFTSEEAASALSKLYKEPNKKLEDLVRRKELIRLKRGLFSIANQFDPLAAAGSIHGPSYLSFETALAFYEMIPERVNVIMSVADNRQLRVKTGQYLFIYRSQERQLFAKGMTAVNLRGRNILIATPEKALLDTIAWHRINTKTIIPARLFEDICNSYRLNGADLTGLSRKHLTDIKDMYRSLAPRMFVEELLKRKNRT